MQRIYLKSGDTLELNSKIYTVKSVIGDGATCVVYSAEYKDNKGYPHRVNIKECYPYNASISREDTILKWELDDEKEKHLKSFDTTYKKLNVWQEGISNVSVYDICDANNTKYIIMEHNKGCVTFDKDNPETLSDILKTVKLLAHYVETYHQNGYLHLDIKPSNFLIYPRPSEHIVLFDLDTVTAISDIETGKCGYASYSDGWAAPEQKQGKINKLCPATDIYAIGAVLFEKILGRQVDNDDVGYFAEWSFDNELFEDVNPKIKRLLTNIFKKTLAASIKRRYQSADALIKDLDKAIKIVDSKVYLKGDDICCSGYFVGREEELKKIKDSFDSKKKAVFLHGFGGIGKTEIARKFAELYKKDYDIVLFVKYDSNSTLQEKLDEIDIANFEGDSAEHRKKLRSLLDDKTLVIIDNFDVEIGVDNGLKSLFDTKAHVLISTRTDFSSVYSGDKYTQIEITELAINELEQVFFNNARIENLTDSDKEILYKIFKLIENHTYATELLAKQMYYSGWSLGTLYDKLKSGFASLESVEKIVTNKDDDTKKDNTLNILRAVYSVSSLSEEQKQVLRNLYLLRFMNISREIYLKYSLSSSMVFDDINTLIEIGLVQYNKVYFSLHPLVEELVNYELKPTVDNCQGIYSVIDSKTFMTGNYDGYDDADEYEFESNCDYLCGFFRRADLTCDNNKALLINWLVDILENENIRIGEADDWRFSPLYEKLLLLSDSETTTPIEQFNIYYIVLLSWISMSSRFYPNNPKMTEMHHKLVEEKTREILPQAVLSCNNIEIDADVYLEKLFDAVVYRLLHEYYQKPKAIIDDILNIYPQAFEKLTAREKDDLGLSLSESEIEELKKEEQEIPAVFKPGYTDEEIDLELSCKKGFCESTDKIAYFNEIINNEKYTPMKRAELLWYCTGCIFDRLHMGLSSKSESSIDWAIVEELLDLEETFLISDECDPKEKDDIQEWNHYIENNTVNQIIVYAATNNFKWFEDTIDILLKEIGRKIKFYIEHGVHWSRFISIRDYETISIERIKNALEEIHKAHLILPVLIRYLEGWQQYAKKTNQYDDRDFFSLYKSIAECASLAEGEKIDEPKYKKDFYDIEYFYREQMDSIAGVDFSIKFDE